MANLCAFKDVLGQPRVGFHAPRVLGFARNDILLTILAGWLLARWLQKSTVLTIVALFALGIILHWLFCVDTAFMQLLK